MLRRLVMRLAAIAAAPLAFGALPGAQHAGGLDPATLPKPTADSGPTEHGDHSRRHHYELKQITADNVQQRTLAWAFQTGQPGPIKATPILVNRVLDGTTPDNNGAIDARSARQIWR